MIKAIFFIYGTHSLIYFFNRLHIFHAYVPRLQLLNYLHKLVIRVCPRISWILTLKYHIIFIKPSRLTGPFGACSCLCLRLRIIQMISFCFNHKNFSICQHDHKIWISGYAPLIANPFRDIFLCHHFTLSRLASSYITFFS